MIYCSVTICTAVVFTQTSPSYSPVCPGDTVGFHCIATGTGSAVWQLNNTGAIVVNSGAPLIVDSVTGFTITLNPISNSTTAVTNGNRTFSLYGATVGCSATGNQGDYTELTIDISG